MSTESTSRLGDFTSPDKVVGGALADLIGGELTAHELGVHVEVTCSFDTAWFLRRMAEQTTYNTGVILAGVAEESIAELQVQTAPTSVRVTDEVSHGVRWRNEDTTEFDWDGASVPDRIVALVRGDPAKLGSLENLSLVTSGQIRVQIASNVQEVDPFSNNVPGRQIWDALCGDVGSHFDIRSIAEYVDATTDYSGQAALEALGTELHHLGLLPDDQLLDNADVAAERIEANIDLVDRVANMAGTDERRLSRSIRQAETDDDRRTRATLVRKIRELHRGNRSILEELEYSDVDELMSTSLSGGGGGGTTRRSPSTYALEAIFDDADGELGNRAEEFTKAFSEAMADDDNSASTSLGDNESLYMSDGVDGDLYRFIQHFIDGDVYGGILYGADDLEDAIESFQSLDTERYDITSDESRFTDLQRFAERTGEFEDLVEALEEYDEARDNLLKHLDALYSAPLLNLLADEHLLDLAQGYLDAYHQAESELDDKYQALSRKAGGGATSLLSEFLLLDTIAIQFEHEEEAYRLVLTPIHPLHLWKFVSLARRVRAERSSIDEQDREFLLSAVERQSHLLRSIDIGSNERLPSAYLIQDGEVGNLPLYVPSAEASVGTNAEIWDHLVPKFLTAHPHASRRLRISVVDPIRPGELLDYLLGLADEGIIDACNVEFVNIQTDREPILRGSDNRDDVIDTFGPDSGDEQFRVQVAEYTDYEEYFEVLDKDPKHLILANDHSAPTVQEFERDQNITIHPLYIPKIYDYNSFDERIQMHSSPEGGVFSSYQNLINHLNTRYSDVHSASVHRLSIGDGAIEGFLKRGVWVTVSSPSTNLDTLPRGHLIANEHRGERDYGIYTQDREYFTRTLRRLFNEYPVDVDMEAIRDLVDSIVEYERSGLLRLVTEETESNQLSRNAKGIIGSILAVKWLEREIPEPKLILSIDDPVTRKWLNLGDSSNRADFLVVRFSGNKSIDLKIVEVKALDDPDTEFETDETASPPTISGPAISDQLLPTTETIRGLFDDDDDLTTAPRREALKEQIFYELMSTTVPGDKQEWVNRINSVFTGDRQPEVTPTVVSVEITSGERSPTQFTAITDETSQDVDLVRLPRPVLHELITGELPEIPDNDSDVATDDETEDDTEADEADRDKPATTSDVDEEDDEPDQPVQSFGDPTTYEEQVDQLRLVLGDFGISVREIDPEKVEVGPNIVRYKIKLGPAEKQSSLESRTEDIARQMAFEREPIIHRLPGTEYIAMDVPRSERATVDLYDYRDHFEIPSEVPTAALPLLAGVTPDGNVYTSDLSDAPHMLVGGSTGSGKTIFLYSLIASILEQKGPEQVQFALLDPKETDFLYFDRLPNLINEQVIADAREAQEFFSWVVNDEIPRRKDLLKEKIARDISEYNNLVDDPNEAMVPLVIVVDEYADLLQQLGDDADATENDVRTIAQVARSLGIHLVIATQRPSHNAIDTDLRANLDMRVAFRLPKQSDSRILIDESGAEELSGDGDMLLKEADRITRLQGFYVDADELRDLVRSYI